MKITESQKLVLSQAIEKWGHESQTGMAIEECAEFIVAARKVSRVGGREIKPQAVENLIDEIADVFVMMEQMAATYGREAIQERIDYKINRLKGRLEAFTTIPMP